MSKRMRFLIILAVTIVALLFLMPTIQWYALIPAEKKMMATSSNSQIKDYAIRQANGDIQAIKKEIFNPFTEKDLKNPALLVKKLKESNTQSDFIRNFLSDAGKKLVNDYSGAQKLAEGEIKTLLESLNTLINGKLLYDPIALKDVKLTQTTKNLASQRYGREDLKDVTGDIGYLNRFILEETYPDAIHPVYLAAKYSFLSAKVRDYYRSVKLNAPSPMTVKAVFTCFSDEKDMIDALEQYYRDDIIALKTIRNGSIQLGLDLRGGVRVSVVADFATMAKDRGKELTEVEKTEAMTRAIEILNSRIDQFGVSEPQIRQQGKDRIVIEMPGLADPERIKGIILGKGRLNFHIVDDDGVQKFNDFYRQNPGDFLDAQGVLKDPSILPVGTILREVVEKDKYGVDERKGYTVLKEEIGLSGSYVVNALVYEDPTTLKPNCTFEMNSQGQDIFYNLTSANVGKYLAVVLDDKVKFQAKIQEAIRGGVRVSGGAMTTQEANDLARILRTGSLPVPLEVIQQEAVGATQGEAGIRMALNSTVGGFLIVMIFMMFYYLGAGVIANFALVLNFYLMAGILSVFNFTITLPSIAGVILTAGMAVDANVIIYERMREELRLGKTRKAVVNAGFGKAFWTIFDSNLTTILAGLVLVYFGKGPVQGFAVVLTIGIISSMFTSLFVSRFCFDFITDVFKANKLSVMWRKVS